MTRKRSNNLNKIKWYALNIYPVMVLIAFRKKIVKEC